MSPSLSNIDTSEIVIEQQKASFPEEKWEVMDVREMRFEDGSFDLVIDKSVLDCLLCYAESHENTHRMLEEVRRVLCPTGLYLVVSLHSVKDVLTHVQALDWRVNPHRVANARWDEGENSRRFVEDHCRLHLSLTLLLLLGPSPTPSCSAACPSASRFRWSCRAP